MLTTTTSRSPARVPCVLCNPSEQLQAVDHGWRRQRGRSKAAAASQAVPSPRTPERRHGPCRVPAPHLTRSEDGMGRRRGARGAQRVAATGAGPNKPWSTLSTSCALLPWCRRLRSWLRHEWMTVAVALAESTHFSSR